MNIDFNSLENGGNKNLLVMVVDNQGRIIFLNKAMEQFTGRPFKELKELNVWELYTGKEESKLIKNYFMNFDSDIFPRKLKAKMLSKEGDDKEIKWTNNILLNRDDQIDRVICFGKVVNGNDEYDYDDYYISETKNAEIDKTSSKHCFCITNDKGKILDISDSYCELSGYTRQELLKMTIYNLDGNSNKNDLTSKIERVIVEGYCTFNTRQRLRNGELTGLKINANYTQNFGGLIFLSISNSDEIDTQPPTDQNKPEFRQYLRAQILDKVSELIFIHDFNGNLIYVNETACKKLGYSKKELFELKLNDLISQDNIDTYESIIKQLINKNEIDIECKYQHKNRNLLDITLGSQIMSVNNRKLILSIANENKKASVSNDKPTNIIEYIVDAVAIIDKDCNIKNCNELFCQLCGYDNSEITGTSIDDLLITGGEGGLIHYFADVEKGNTQFLVALLKHKNGKKINIELGATYIPDGNGKFYVLLRNITKQKMLADGYKNSLEINNLLNTHSKSIVFKIMIKPKLKFEYISDTVNAILGYPAKEFYENPDFYLKITNSDDIKRLQSMSGELNANPVTLRCRHENDTTIYMEIIVKPTHNNKGELTGYEGSARDITFVNKMESDLNKRSGYINAITQNLKWGAIVISSDHNIIWQNNIARELFPEGDNKRCHDFIFNSPEICSGCIFEVAGKEHYNEKSITINSVNNGDTGRDYKITCIPIDDNDGKMKEQIALFVPVEFKETEKSIRENEIDISSIDGTVLPLSSTSLLCEMNELLNSCISKKEAKKTISKYLPKLFPIFDGSMFLYKSTVNLFEPLISWGDNTNSSSIFPPEACLAIRRGKKYIADGEDSDDVCEHINKALARIYLEIPMVYQGDKIGLLHLQQRAIEGQEKQEKDNTTINDETILLAQVVADQIATVLTCFKLTEKIHEQSRQDQATGLFNRKYMEHALEREIYMAADNKGQQVGLIILSLENFNDFVDAQGHYNGDFLLRNFGILLKNGCATEDIICRCDANKFAIIIPRSSPDNIKQKALNIYEIAKFINISDKNSSFVPLHLSIGLALYPDHGKKTEEILHTAYNAVLTNREKLAKARDRNISEVKESIK